MPNFLFFVTYLITILLLTAFAVMSSSLTDDPTRFIQTVLIIAVLNIGAFVYSHRK
ncbi:hypothetical protein A5gp_00053 [Alteromonas phage vB_AemP_PT15-A5]|nr:hypothetical protein A5gp_00053 [Alteromonas phage vB_AemP_PT15-A5]